MKWMLMPFKRYAEFSGRSRRMEFWMFQLLNILVALVTLGLAIIMGNTTSSSESQTGDGAFAASAGFNTDFTESPVAMILVGIYGLYFLAALVPSIAVTVRRLHDRNMSGWWYLGFIVLGIIPVVGVIASIVFLVIMFLPGTQGPNRFGEDPKNPGNAQVFE